MNKYIFIFTLFFTLPILSCRQNLDQSSDVEYQSYISNFQLVQENSRNNTTIKITSPKAMLNPSNNNIEIFDSSIKILNSNNNSLEIQSGNSRLDNYKKLIRVFNKVNISLLDKNNSFIITDSFDWDLNSSYITLNSPLLINFDNTKIITSSGSYNIDSGLLKTNNNIFNRSILNDDGEFIYTIKVIADMAKWLKENNSIEFNSYQKQVETTINFLNIE